MSDVRSRLASLTPAERAELLRRLQRERQSDAAPLPRADRSQPLPLSFAQRRLWFLRALEGRSAAYNMPAAFRLHGPLDVPAVVFALHEIARRHEVLRTRLIEHDGEPVQVIDPPEVDPGAARVRTVRLGALSAAEREEAARVLTREHVRHPFDLAHEHPFRTLLIELDLREHVLVVNLDHTAADGWSTGVLIAEFAALYNAAHRGEANPLPELPLQYADYALWQRCELADEAAQAPQIEFWRSRLAGAPGAVHLPADGTRGARPGADGASIDLRIDAELASAATALARETDASSYIVLLAAFVALLARWSGDADITVGSPIANRPRKEFEGLIGFFVNTLALRVTLADDPSFRTLVQRVRAMALEAFARADVPFELLVEKLNPPRRLDRSPFFDVMFALQSGTLDEAVLDDVRIETLPVATDAARFDLTLALQETAAGLHGRLEFSTARFAPETAQRFADHYRNLLASAVGEPAVRVSRLDLLSRGERHRLLVEWNRTDAPRGDECLHELVEAQAAKTPDAIAVRGAGAAWTYRRLMDESERVARLLQQHGVGPEIPIGVCLPRSPALIAALLGVLRAGGAYVALDPAYPAERIRFTLADSHAPIVLTTSSVDATLFAVDGSAGPAVLQLDREAAPLEATPFAPAAVRPEHLAYVLYTSGSTGRPKGVAIEHRAPVALVRWARSVWNADDLRGVLAGTSVCFDLSVFEMFVPLAVGGAVVVADTVLDVAQHAHRDAVTLVNTVPSAIDALLVQNGLPPGVRVVNLAGEPLTTALADRVYDAAPAASVYDLYGPSEATTYATCALRARGAAPTIGRPIANTRLYLLDAALQPVPAGLPGEIYLAGDGLARGYLGRPDLTAERFVPNPFARGERLYRTGDRARYRADGSVEFLGRLDHQVKLRGFRIELGEIEAVLGEVPGVRACAVTLRETAAGSTQLVAHVAHADGASIVTALQAQLRVRLPAYMVPSLVVVRDALPLTPSGKVDRSALSVVATGADGGGAPLTEHEQRLAALWTALLRAAHVGRDDDFFVLGGHSLLAARLASKIRDSFGVELPLRAIFEHPTLGAQAAAIAERSGGTATFEPIPRLAVRERLPLSFAQERLWFLDQLEPGNVAYLMTGGIRLRGAVDVAALQAAFAGVIARHEVLRTAFPTVDGRAVTAPVDPPPALRTVDLHALPPHERHAFVERFLRDDAERPFDLARGPLIRAAALCVDANETILAVTMHHIVSDGWSIDVFLREWCARYASAVDPGAPVLTDGELQYADVAGWQRERFASGALAPQLTHWRAALADAPPLLELPTDRPRPNAQSYRGASHAFAIDAPTAALVARRAGELGVTAFMLLLAAFAATLGRWSQRTDLVIGFPSAGRTRSELEPLIGLFVNTLPLRVRLDAAPTFRALIEQVRAHTLDALAHQDVPFEKLVDALGVERSLAWSPVFQVMFVLQNGRVAPTLPGDLRAEPIAPPPATTAKFDLTLAVAEGEDGFGAVFEYDTALFEATTVAGVADELVELLRAGLATPDLPLTVAPQTAAARPSAVAPPHPAATPHARHAPATPAEAVVAEIWRAVLRRDDIGVTDNFFELGGDSIVSIRVVAGLRERGWRIDPKHIFRHQTIRALAAVAEPLQAGRDAHPDEIGPLPLTPVQRLFFAQRPPSPHHYNQSLLLRVDPAASSSDVLAALRAVQGAHPALRTRFRRGPDGWESEIVADVDLAFEEHDLRHEPPAARADRLAEHCDDAQRALDLTQGPLVRAVLVRLAPDEARLLLVAHHLVVDAVSWRVLLSDLDGAYARVRRGEPPALAPEACGPAEFRRRLARRFTPAVLERERAFWTPVLAHAGDLLAAFPGAGVPRPTAVLRSLSAAETEALHSDVRRTHGADVADVLLGALGAVLCELSGRAVVLVDVERHGRDALDDVDLSRSVGWFTSLAPVAVRSGASSAVLADVHAALRDVPRAGLGFGMLQWHDDASASATHTDVCFNYLGQTGADAVGELVRGIGREAAGAEAAADLPRRYRLECNAAEIDGELVLQFRFDAANVDAATIATIADRALAGVQKLVSDARGEVDALLDDLDVSDLLDG